MSLKERFDATHSNSLFAFEKNQNVPIQDLPHFLEQIWTAVKSEKDLNLPGEKTILAEFRCN